MTAKTTYLFLLCFIPLFCWSQDAQLDSMKKLVASGGEDSFKVNTLLNISKRFFSSAPNESIKYATQARDLSEKIDFKSGLAYSYKNIGIANYMQGNYPISLENYQLSLAVFDSLADKKGSSNILSNIGSVYFDISDDIKALDYYLRSLKLSEEIGDKLRTATALLNIGSVYSNKTLLNPSPENIDKALEYYLKALPLAEEVKDDYLIGTSTANMGEMYMLKTYDKSALDSALVNFRKSLKAYKGSDSYPYALMNIGKLYAKRKEYPLALQYLQEAYNSAKNLDARLDMTKSLIELGDTYYQQGDKKNALQYYTYAEALGVDIGAKSLIKSAYEGLAKTYADQKDFTNAYRYEKLYSTIKDTLYNNESDKKLDRLQFEFDIEKKQGEINLLTKDKALQEVNIKRQKLTRNALIGGLTLAMIIAVIIYRNYRNKLKTNKILDEQKTEIETLLLNILPADVAQELQKHGVATARYYERASVLFTDIKSFSKLADELSPQEVVTELNECFIAFDEIIEKYNLEKIKTIGDSYMCAGGIPRVDDAHILNIVKASLEIQNFIIDRNVQRKSENLPPWDIRIGINTGPLVAGVVGKKKYAYDIWGGTVNIASRMESNGEAGRVNISEATYELIKHKYACTHRGKIFAKNIGEIDMYFIDHELS